MKLAEEKGEDAKLTERRDGYLWGNVLADFLGVGLASTCLTFRRFYSCC